MPLGTQEVTIGIHDHRKSLLRDVFDIKDIAITGHDSKARWRPIDSDAQSVVSGRTDSDAFDAPGLLIAD